MACDEKAIAALHQDMRAIAEETPKSGARTRVGHRYYPSRFVQAADRAVEHGVIVKRCQKWLHEPIPDGTLDPLIDANRPDLTLEWLVLDPQRPYYECFSEEDREAAKRRLTRFSD
jgi:hypothetical protein